MGRRSGRALDDAAYAPALIGVLSFLCGKTDRSDWRRFVNKNAPKICVVLKPVFDEVTSDQRRRTVTRPRVVLLLVVAGLSLGMLLSSCGGETQTPAIPDLEQR